MNDKEISITYDGTRVIIETNDDSINISRIQAYNLIKLLQNLDASYNLKGRDITEKEWLDRSMFKYIIKRDGCSIKLDIHHTIYKFIAFHTEEQRDEFLKNNEQLVKDYLMIE